MSNEELKASIKNKYRHTSSFWAGISVLFLDAIAITISTGIGFFIVNLIVPDLIWLRSFIKYTLFLPLTFLLFYVDGLYPGILISPEEEIKKSSICTFIIFIVEVVAISTIKNDKHTVAIACALITAWPFATFLIPFIRECGRRFFSHLPAWGVPVIIYTHKREAEYIAQRLLTRKFYGYKPVLIITDDEAEVQKYNEIQVVTYSDEIQALIKKLRIKVAIICGYEQHIDKIQSQFRYIIRIPKDQMDICLSTRLKNFGGILAYYSTNYLTKPHALLAKRLIDIFLCLVASPFVILASLFIIPIIKITSPGPVFYGHKRVGKNHKEIKCWKFRSMCTNSQEILQEILATDPVRAAEWEKDRKFTDDPRVTKFGKILRKTSLDELPQLWNIFIGEMSFVGPRPVTEGELEKYGKYADFVLSVTPGLSGMWQISGRSDTGYEERIALDSYYIQNWSVWLDIWIIIKTIWVVLKGKGAY